MQKLHILKKAIHLYHLLPDQAVPRTWLKTIIIDWHIIEIFYVLYTELDIFEWYINVKAYHALVVCFWIHDWKRYNLLECHRLFYTELYIP